MMVQSYNFLLVISLIVYLIYEIITLRKVEKVSKFREIVKALFFIYFLMVIHYTFDSIFISDQINKFYFNLIPIKETIEMFRGNINVALYNVVGNTLMFVPLGVFIPVLFKRKDRISWILLYGFLASFFIEINQFFIKGNRAADVDDIIFNTIGAVIGYAIYKVIIMVLGRYKFIDKIINEVGDSSNGLIKKALIILMPIFIIFQIFVGINREKYFKSLILNEEEIIETFNNLDNQEIIATKENDNEKRFLVKSKDDMGEKLEVHNYNKISSDEFKYVDMSEVLSSKDNNGNIFNYKLSGSSDSKYFDTIEILGYLNKGNKAKITIENDELFVEATEKKGIMKTVDISKYKVDSNKKIKISGVN